MNTQNKIISKEPLGCPEDIHDSKVRLNVFKKNELIADFVTGNPSWCVEKIINGEDPRDFHWIIKEPKA